MPETDHVVPNAPWKFNEDVAKVFTDMLSRSIPQYEVMRDSVFNLASKFVQLDTYILDLGCSDGKALEPLVDQFRAHNKYVGIDVSEPMLERARQRFSIYKDSTVSIDIKHLDLREYFPEHPYSVIQAVLTFCFIPIEYRQRVVQDCYNNLLPGGALIVVDKVLGATATLDKLFVSQYYGMKRNNGYSELEIERKRLSLEGVLVPITMHWELDLLSHAGFRYIDCFWRWMNFMGIIAIK